MIDLLFRRLRRLLQTPYGQSNPTNRERFETVFRTRRWATGQSVSGPGSDLGSGSVEHSIRMLTKTVDELGVRSIADVPCGDFNWFDLFLRDRPQVDYVGYDIVAPLIAQNRAAHPGRRFEVLDIVTEVPAPADLIFSKDLVNHLYERDVWATLRNMSASGARWLMITSNTGAPNKELTLLRSGASRELDLQTAPYSLPTPVWSDHYLSLWRAEDVAARVAEHDRQTA
ncbi:trans-aconitate 2-methyltransferase [Brevundimonas staleyi]|uniref:Trans-aconitate 2-methyltransferase n=1 Tax=Brevundimonas staleyi TaxID=74326 RepID=A0ABW0FUN7_9CAUL